MDERTSLLKKNGDSRHVENVPKKKKPVHYRNIDGRGFKLLFACSMFGYVLAFRDSTLMASSHPVITSYFNASNSASWLSTVFYLTATIFQPICGRMSDTVGRKPILLLSICIFFVGSAGCAAAQDIGQFIAARGVCGLGTGGIIALAAICISDTVKIEFRGIYQSFLNLAYCFGCGTGAAFGGYLCDSIGWRWAFGINCPFLIVYGIVSYFTVPNNLGPNLAKSQGKTLGEAFKSFDTVGAVGLTVVVTALILGINLGGNVLTWTHPVVIGSLVLFVVATITLIPVERRAKQPMLPLRLLNTIPNANLMWSNVLFTICTQTILFNMPLFLQIVRGMSATASGLYLVAPLIGASVTAVSAGFVITWTRRFKYTLNSGVLFLVIGTIGATLLTTYKQIPNWAIVFMIAGPSIGQGFFFSTSTISLLSVNAIDEQAVVITTLSLLRNIGAITGVAFSSWVLQNALLYELESQVKGSPDEKASIIEKVRESVKAIQSLDPVHKQQVVKAYARALNATFISSIVIAVIVAAMVLFIKLPLLPSGDTQPVKRRASRSKSMSYGTNDLATDNTSSGLERVRSHRSDIATETIHEEGEDEDHADGEQALSEDEESLLGSDLESITDEEAGSPDQPTFASRIAWPATIGAGESGIASNAGVGIVPIITGAPGASRTAFSAIEDDDEPDVPAGGVLSSSLPTESNRRRMSHSRRFSVAAQERRRERNRRPSFDMNINL